MKHISVFVKTFRRTTTPANGIYAAVGFSAATRSEPAPKGSGFPIGHRLRIDNGRFDGIANCPRKGAVEVRLGGR